MVVLQNLGCPEWCPQDLSEGIFSSSHQCPLSIAVSARTRRNAMYMEYHISGGSFQILAWPVSKQEPWHLHRTSQLEIFTAMWSKSSKKILFTFHVVHKEIGMFENFILLTKGSKSCLFQKTLVPFWKGFQLSYSNNSNAFSGCGGELKVFLKCIMQNQNWKSKYTIPF